MGKNEAENVRFKTLFDYFPDALMVISKDGGIQKTNQEFQELFGMIESPPSTIKDFLDRIFRTASKKQSLIELILHDIDKARESEVPPRRVTVTTEGGKSRDVIFRPIDTEDDHILMICTDFTAEHRMESELLNFATKRHQLEKIINRSPAVVVSWLNVKGRPVEYISENINQFGYTSGEFLGHQIDYLDIIHPDDRKWVLKESEKYVMQPDRNRYHQEYRIYTKDGEIRWVSDNTVLIRDDEGSVVRYQAIITDITEKKEAISDLEFERQQFLNIFDSIAEPIYVTDPKTYEVVYVNPALKDMIGHDPEGGICYEEFQNLKEPCSFCTNDVILNNNMEPYRWEYHNPNFDRDYFIMDRIITWPDGRNLRFEIAYDVTALKRIESELAAEKELLMVTLKTIKDGVVTLDENGVIVLVNDATTLILGKKRNELISKPFDDVVELLSTSRDGKITIMDDLNSLSNTSQNIEKSAHLVVNGEEREIECSMAMTSSKEKHKETKHQGWVVVLRDVTEQRRLEQEIFKRQKIESIQLIAGGIAHDFNNLLTSILGNISLLRYECEDHRADLMDILDDAERASLSARRLTNQLLTFSSGGQPIKKIENLESIIKNSAKFASHGSGVDIYYNISSELWSVKVDRGQLGQVVHNLVINAIQAMDDKGSITIDASNVQISEGDMVDLPSGKYVKTSVADSGCGIPEEILPKIFDLYFSTKPKGTGLGLSICYSIIMNHRGTLTVKSKLGKGSTFTFYLPAVAGKKYSLEEGAKELYKMEGRVLILEDEPLVGKSLKYMLKKLNLQTTLRVDGASAIEEYNAALESDEPYDAVILDLTVPGGMGGEDVIKELKKLDPNVNAILSTGYAFKDVIEKHKELGFKDILLKPYKINALSEILNKILNE